MPTKLTDEQRVRSAEVNWSDNESVCVAAVPDAVAYRWRTGEHSSYQILSSDTCGGEYTKYSPSVVTEDEAWRNMRANNPTVQEYERARTVEDHGDPATWSDEAFIERGGVLEEVRKLPSPLAGPAMEAMVRACAEAVWQMYYEPRNLTWDALKERTFEAVLALLLSAHKPLLERIRELEAERDGIRDVLREMAVWHSSVHDDGCPEDDTCDCSLKSFNDRVNAACGEIEPEALTFMARAEAAEAKVRDLEAAAGAARAEIAKCGNVRAADKACPGHGHICIRPRGHGGFCATTLEDPDPTNKGCSWWPEAYRSEPKGASK